MSMQPIEQALNEVRALHERVNRTPAPELGPQSFLPFPPGQDPVSYAIEEVARLKQWLATTAGTAPAAAQWVPRASVFAGETDLTFELELPGVAKEDVSVTVANGELVVSGQRPPFQGGDGVRAVVVEQPWGTFERRFPLPAWADPECVTARYLHGVLEITLTKNDDERAGGFRVEIG